MQVLGEDLNNKMNRRDEIEEELLQLEIELKKEQLRQLKAQSEQPE